MPAIVLATLNARYYHAALGLRYLAANMGDMAPHTRILEFVIQHSASDVVEAILAEAPQIVGLGVYIWNLEETTQVVATLKKVAPNVIVVLGGPEVSYEWQDQPIVAMADYVITGWGDVSFPALCRAIFENQRPEEKIIAGVQPELSTIKMPYALYSDEDIAHRLLYVEASRGCPFKCEFCLSALDKTAWPFDLDLFLAEMAKLYQRGARQFKFVDRTFNLNVKTSARILEFFLERLDDKLFVHFEVIPDHLPDNLKTLIARFPPGSLQFEIGVQTFNPIVQALISRKQDNHKTEANLRWLRANSHAHLHVDLIVGLPGEDIASFAQGFDRLIAMRPHEIQVGILKRLRGTPIVRHTQDYDLRFAPYPPYALLSNSSIDFATMQRMIRFARYWDLIGNSGRFRQSLILLFENQPFARFLVFSDWLYAKTQQTHQIALDRLFDLLYVGLTDALGVTPTAAYGALALDYARCGAKGAPIFLQAATPDKDKLVRTKLGHQPRRQSRHLAS